MKNKYTLAALSTKSLAIFVVLGGAFASISALPAKASACVAPSVDYGQVSTSVTAPDAGTYRIWSRVMVPDTTNNKYLLEVDGTQCYTVATTTTGNWVWVDYQNGNTASKITLSLTKGTHSIKLIGAHAGVKVDRIILTSDQNCTPSGFGDNCNVAVDTAPPAVSLTAPAEASSVSGATAITATASDAVGVTKVEFYVNSVLKTSAASSPYSYQWDTTTAANGQQLLTAKAYDAAGNSATSSYYVTVSNGDTQAPSTPGSFTARATAHNNVALSWTASTDNKGVTGYTILRNGAILARTGAVTSYQDQSVIANTAYSYTISAVDAVGNQSSTTTATVTTPNVADTQAPTAPGQLSATVISSRQINLTWQASTDNTGLAGYDIYRTTGTGTASKIATVNTTSFGDTGLSPNTNYTYSVKARDPAGNTSNASNTVSAKTLQNKRKSRIIGIVSGSLIPNAKITISISGVKYTATTNKYGIYIIKGIPSGRYNMSVNAAGYKSRSITLVVEDTTVIKNIKLQKK
jgi:chitodextrinase